MTPPIYHFASLRALRRLVIIASSIATASAADETPPQRMNVLLIMSDDLRTEPGCYGGRALTPNLDKLAKDGVRFDRAYCQYPLCNASRSSMLTGRHPVTTGVYGNREWFGATHPDWVSLPKYFKQQGYTTVRNGKIFHGDIDDFEAWTEGGERHKVATTAAAPPKPTATTDQEETERVKKVAADDARRAPGSDRWEATPGPDAERTHGDSRVTDRTLLALRKVKEQGTRPFFIACGLSKPHSPLVAPKRFFDLYRVEDLRVPVDFKPAPTVPEGFPAGSIRSKNADLFIGREATDLQAREMALAYLACVSFLDWNIGRVLTELDTLGLRDSTIVVFCSDHGYQLGEKGKWSKAGSLWEQGARVPVIIHDPRAKGNGKSTTGMAGLIDLYPTLVELAGLPQPTGLEGRSLAPLLAEPEKPWDHPVFTVWNERSRGLSGVVVRTGKWRYAEFFGRGAGAMLTDPVNDPHELKNLAADPQHAELVKELSALIKAHAEGKTEPSPAAAR